MLINLRNALMTGKRLPYDAELEYIESTGTQWIDTGVIAGDDTTFSVRFNCTSTNDTAIYGGRSQSQGRQWILPLQMNQIQFGYGSIYQNINVQYRGNWLNIDTSLSAESYTYKVATDGGVETLTSTPRQSFTNTAHILLFAAWNNTAVGYKTVAKVAKFQIWKNGVLVRDYIPVRVGSGASAVGYMYDRVSGKLFGNAGTGDFVLGQDVVPVEWLRSSGSQWIDTGVVPAANDTYTVETRKLDARQDNASFGLAAVVYCFANPAGTFWCHPALGAGGRNGINPLGNTNWHTIVASPTSVSVDGVALGYRTSDAQSPLSTVKLFARGNNSASGDVAKNYNGMISHVLVNRGGSDLRKFYSVRVGTEGAMMDTLTRRIYRNAGTSAFTYGNDLKYPIPAE